MDYKKIASNINAIREARGWSKDKLAKRTGISYTSVVNHTTDGQMSLESLAKYAGALGCTIGDQHYGPGKFGIDRFGINPVADSFKPAFYIRYFDDGSIQIFH